MSSPCSPVSICTTQSICTDNQSSVAPSNHFVHKFARLERISDMTIDADTIELLARDLGAGLDTIGVAGAGVGIGNLFGSFVSAVGRNPAVRDRVFRDVLLGFALTEAVALYALVIALIILFAT